MPGPLALEIRIGLEKKILRCLCTEDQPGLSASELRNKFATYNWCDHDNRVVFESLERLRSSGTLTASQLREQLPAQATRVGFPDVNWENFLERNQPGTPDIRALVQELLAAK